MKYIIVLLFLLPASSCVIKPSSTIKVSSDYYDNRELIVQGGVWSEGNTYNEFKYVDSSGVVEESAKYIKPLSGSYKFKVEIIYPHPFQFAYIDTATQSGLSSQIFYVGNEDVDIKIDDLNLNKNVLSGKISKINREYLTLQTLYKDFVNLKNFSIEDPGGKLQVMEKYVMENPDSYVALWDLILNYQVYRFEKDRRKILGIIKLFSDEVKISKTLVAFQTELYKDLQLVEGVIIPNIFITGHDSLVNIASKNNFTLIDFWFSSCVPCIEQFGILKEIYASNKNKSFEIVGISIDSEKQKLLWKQTILKYDLPWIQHLDFEGKIANEFFIKEYPSNFLIDKEGRIIKVNIEPSELKDFLKKELK